MNMVLKSKSLKQFMVILVVCTGLFSGYVQAKMVPTATVISSDGQQYDQQQLLSALASDELKQQLQELGVDTGQLNDRIASLTAEEVQQLNAELSEQPAGGIVGVLLTIFVVLVVTDMLCATDVFAFVKCINK